MRGIHVYLVIDGTEASLDAPAHEWSSEETRRLRVVYAWWLTFLRETGLLAVVPNAVPQILPITADKAQAARDILCGYQKKMSGRDSEQYVKTLRWISWWFDRAACNPSVVHLQIEET